MTVQKKGSAKISVRSNMYLDPVVALTHTLILLTRVCLWTDSYVPKQCSLPWLQRVHVDIDEGPSIHTA